jgi:bacillolysin
MKSCWLIATSLCSALLITPAADARPLTVQPSASQWQGRKMTDLRARVAKHIGDPAELLVMADPQTGTLRVLKGADLGQTKPSLAGIRGWLNRHRAVLGLDDPARELHLLRYAPATADNPWHYARFRQHVVLSDGRTLEVVERGLTVLMDDTGRVHQLTGNLIMTPGAIAAAHRSPDETLADAQRYAGFTGISAMPQQPARVVVHTLGERARIAHAHVVSYPRGESAAPYYKRLYIDARSGQLLGQRELIWTQQAATCSGDDWTNTNRDIPCAQFQDGSRAMFDLVTLGNTIQTTDAQQGDNLGGVAIFANGTQFNEENAVSAAYGIQRSYEYYQDFLGRPSWNHDGNGNDLGQFTTVNYGFQYPNAFATVVQLQSGENASLSVFGNGDGFNLGETTQCLDVAGHELTHNVVASTAGLVYENQPGALNEHFADAFGTAIDKHYEDNDDIMGENCTPGGNGIRNMQNPNLHNQPDHMNQFQNLPNNENGDYGGVHINSGIPNKAFFDVYDQLGIETAEQIWYQALNQGGLGDRAEFLDFANAIVTACATLGMPAGDCQTVGSALSDVGLTVEVGDGGGNCPANSSPSQGGCVCDAGFRPNTAGTGCEPIEQLNCPPNSTQIGEYCYCDDGYAPDADGATCVPENEAPCPENAHREGGICVCDDGYAGDPESPQGSCELQAGNCGLFETYNGSSCECIPGFELGGGGQCVPGTNGCGNETWIGRCEQGSQYVVYCDDVTDPNNPAIQVLDCFGQPDLACGFNSEQSYYDCVEASHVPAPTGCGDVPTEGICNGNTLERCVNDEVVSTNCVTTGGTCETLTSGPACVPEAWQCVPDYFADADCDCGCGAPDPTCPSAALDPAECNYTWCGGAPGDTAAIGGESDPANHANCAGAAGDGDGDGDGDPTGDGDGDGDGDTLGDGDGDPMGDGDGDPDPAFNADGGVEPISPGISGGAQSGCSSVMVAETSLPAEAIGLGLLVGLLGLRRRRRVR